MTPPNASEKTAKTKLPIHWVEPESFSIPCKLRQGSEQTFPPYSILISATPETPIVPPVSPRSPASPPIGP